VRVVKFGGWIIDAESDYKEKEKGAVGDPLNG